MCRIFLHIIRLSRGVRIRTFRLVLQISCEIQKQPFAMARIHIFRIPHDGADCLLIWRG